MYLKIKKDGNTFFGEPLNENSKEYNIKEIFSDKEIVIDKKVTNNLIDQPFNFFDGGIFERVYNFLQNDKSFFSINEKIKIVSESDDIYENFMKRYNLKVLSNNKINSIKKLQEKILIKIDEYELKFINDLNEISDDEGMEEEIEILKEDLKNKFNDFKVNYLNKITFDNFTKFWPTLLNPSPYMLYLK